MQEFFEEVGGYGGAVFGGAADVVDGEGFGGEGGAGGWLWFAGVMGWLRRDCSVAVRRVGRSRRLAAPMRMSSMSAVVHAGEGGYGYLGDGLCVAGAYFAGVGFVTGEVTFYCDAVEELVGGEGGLFVAEVEVGVGHGAGAGCGDEGECRRRRRAGRVGSRRRGWR